MATAGRPRSPAGQSWGGSRHQRPSPVLSGWRPQQGGRTQPAWAGVGWRHPGRRGSGALLGREKRELGSRLRPLRGVGRKGPPNKLAVRPRAPSLSLGVPFVKAREEHRACPCESWEDGHLAKAQFLEPGRPRLKAPWVPSSVKWGPAAHLEEWREGCKSKRQLWSSQPRAEHCSL